MFVFSKNKISQVTYHVMLSASKSPFNIGPAQAKEQNLKHCSFLLLVPIRSYIHLEKNILLWHYKRHLNLIHLYTQSFPSEIIVSLLKYQNTCDLIYINTLLPTRHVMMNRDRQSTTSALQLAHRIFSAPVSSTQLRM